LKTLKDLTYVLACLSLFSNGQTLQQRGVAHVSKVDIEAKTRKTNETFTIKSMCDLAPPLMEVQMNALYILLSQKNKTMDQTMFENPKEALTLLMRMEIEHTLRNTLMSTFGQWYLFPLVSLLLLNHYHCFAP
jgi:hypothetical protein